MKTRYKILIFAGIIFFILLIYGFLTLTSSYSDFNDCWYDDGKGNKLPCEINIEFSWWPFFSPKESVDCDEECPEVIGISNPKWKQKIIDGDVATTFKEMYPDNSLTYNEESGVFSYVAISGGDTVKLTMRILFDDSLETKYVCEISDVGGKIILRDATSDELKSNLCFRQSFKD